MEDILKKAIEIVINNNSASLSYLQRRLRIGYFDTKKLIDEMESKGIVGPAYESRPRKVLIHELPKAEAII